MIPDKDTELLKEAYISATQKTVNVPPRVPYRQVGDQHKVNTLSDKMQGVQDETEVISEPSGESPTQAYDDAVKRLITPEEDIPVSHEEPVTTSSMTPATISIGLTTHDNDCDDSVRMTKTNLYSIFNAAKKLHDFLENGHTPEVWVAHKIAVCADSMLNVLKVSEYEYDKSTCL